MGTGKVTEPEEMAEPVEVWLKTLGPLEQTPKVL